jgi:hypothetical protein
MGFLADAHQQRGVLRQTGSVYQFRHADLQRRLATRLPLGAIGYDRSSESIPIAEVRWLSDTSVQTRYRYHPDIMPYDPDIFRQE